MCSLLSRCLYLLLATLLACSASISAQQDPFRWMDFHARKDQDIVAWVTRSLDREKWTAIREIGVQYDAALVVTTLRPNPQSPAGADTFAVWSVSLTSHIVAPILTGVNLRWLDWMRFVPDAAPELAALYDDCNQCAATTFFTAFHYDRTYHVWTARWMRGGQAAPIWSAGAQPGVTLTQVYATLTELNGRQLVGTWSRFDYGNLKPPEDYLYQYDLDPFSGLERTQMLTGKAVEPMKQRLCGAQGGATAMARGQDSPLCQQFLKPNFERKPVTTPPANNRGQSLPPSARH
jgi:hypothetical protein